MHNNTLNLELTIRGPPSWRGRFRRRHNARVVEREWRGSSCRHSCRLFVFEFGGEGPWDAKRQGWRAIILGERQALELRICSSKLYVMACE